MMTRKAEPAFPRMALRTGPREKRIGVVAAPRTAWYGAAALLIFSLALAACNWERNAYRTLATAQITYDKAYSTIAELCARGQASTEYCAGARGIAQRIYDLGKSTTTLLVFYQQTKDADVKQKILAAVAELPGLLAELERFARGVKPGGDDAAAATFLDESAPLLEKIDAHLKVLEAAR